MSAPAWARWLLRRAASPDRVEEAVGDLEEAHRARVARRGRLVAAALTGLEAVDMGVALLRERWSRRHERPSSMEALRRRGGRGAIAGTTVGLSWLDFRLGARMLARYPGVTIVGGLAMTIGVGLGAGYLEVSRDFFRPTLPLDEGERIVGVRTWDAAENDPELRTLHDFVVWRDEVVTIRDLSAYRTVDRNLGLPGEAPDPATGAEMTPSAFVVTRVAPRLGRTLVEEDAREGAPPVVVLGHGLWRSRFGGDPGIVGEAVRLGGGTAVVVGVMPEGFAFPVRHEFWVPLRAESMAYGPRQGPAVQVFGRLAPAATLAQARAELAALGARAATDASTTHEHLRPQVVPYTQLFAAPPAGAVPYMVQLVFVALLMILASNVATMIFARTATRENEIAMRYALGASRGRILAQLFAEAFVLALVAAAIGLLVVGGVAAWLTALLWQVTEGQVPFWVDRGLNPTTVLYAMLLAILAALVAGVLPALRATGSRLQTRLRHAPGTAGSRMRFGGVWGAVIAVQVALAVFVIPPAAVAIGALAEAERADAGFATEEYLSARVELDADRPPADSAAAAALGEDFRGRLEELRRRLLEEPGVSRVTFATRLPGMDHPTPYVEVDSVPGDDGERVATWVMWSTVEPGYFEAFGAEMVAGRDFGSADAGSDPPVVVVNETFVRQILAGRSAVGRRVRVGGGYGRWYEIVGVVSDLGMDTDVDAFHPGRGPGVYQPLGAAHLGTGGSHAIRMAFHVRGDAGAFAPRLRAIARGVDPSLRLYDVLPLDRPVDRGNRTQRLVARFSTWTTALVAVIAILISIAGTYSVLAFTVARQTREIGIRIALGADRGRIVRAVFSRAFLQIGTGVVVGSALWLFVMFRIVGADADDLGLLVAAAAALVLVGVGACAAPVRRALRIEPTEALREVG